MSTIHSNARPPPPGDEDLQHLYDEVWRIFGEESASPTDRSPTSAVSASTREPYPNGSFHDINATISPSSSARHALPRPPGLFYIPSRFAQLTHRMLHSAYHPTPTFP